MDAGGLNAETQISYDSLDQIVSMLMPNGESLTLTWNDARRLTKIENALGESIGFQYNLMGGVTETRLDGQFGTTEGLIQNVIDARNRLKSTVIGPATTLPLEASFTHDKESNVTSFTDGRDNSWTRTFDALDRIVQETDPDVNSTQFTFEGHDDVRGSLASVTDGRGALTTYERNGFGEIIAEVSAEAGRTDYVRDERGLVTSRTDARGQVTTYTYDAAGRILSETYSGDATSDVTYTYDQGANGIGRLTTVAEAFGDTVYTYTPLGFIASEARDIGPHTYTTSYEYDLAGNVTKIIYPTGLTVDYLRDAAARVIEIIATEPGGGPVSLLDQITYKPFGPMSGARYGDNHQLSITYDQAYRATSLVRNRYGTDLMNVGFTHDANGNITAMTDNVNSSRSQSFNYDPLNRLTQASGGYGQLDYSYNAVGDRTSRTTTPGVPFAPTTETYEYDATTFRLSRTLVGTEERRVFTYEASGQISSDTRNYSPDDISYAGYDGFASQTWSIKSATVTVPDGAVSATLSFVSYNPGPNLNGDFDFALDDVSLILTGGLVSPVTHNFDLAEDFDHVWQIGNGFAMTDETIDGRSAVRFTKTDAGEAVGWTTDIVGGIVGTSDQQGFDLSVSLNGATSIDYDYAGRTFSAGTDIESRIEFYDAQGQRILNFDLNGRDRIETVYRDGAVAASYIYDIHEQRVGKTMTDAYGNVTDTHYHYDGEGRLIAETDAATGQFVREYVWLGLTPIATYGENPNPGGGGGPTVLHYLHADHLGRPVFATDVAGQAIWDGGITTPFGLQVSSLGAVTQALMFPGQYADEETGYFDNWHRTYDPTLGRYLQSDPIGLAGGLNRYAYVGGNPVGFTDSKGLNPDGWEFLPPSLVGIEAHTILENLTIGRSNFTANRSVIRHGSGVIRCRINGRPDLININTLEVWELKPYNNPNAIQQGRAQIAKYTSSRHPIDRMRGTSRGLPIPGGAAPAWVTSGPHRGRYGTYYFTDQGGGLITYKVFLDRNKITVNVPWWVNNPNRDQYREDCLCPL